MSKRRILPKAQVTYNVVTNNDHPDTHWKGVEKPSPKKEYVKKVNTDIFRDFNIVSNKYWEGHDDKDKKDRAEIKQDLDDKYKKTHDFNYVTCSYYDQGKEDAFVQDRKEKQANHGKEYLNRLPPTLRMRETIVFDSSKAVPEEVKRFDEFKKNQKKRYEKRYEVEQELRDRDIELQDRNEDLALNRYRGEKYYEEKFKGFDNFTLSNTRDQIKSLEPHARNKPKLSLWEHIQHEAQEQLPERPGMATEALPPKVVNREVNVDEIPQYQRGELAPVQEKTQSQRPPTPEPEIPQYSQPPAQDQPFFNSQNLATSYPENNQFQQYSSQIPDLRGGNSVQGGSVRDSEKPSNGVSQGLFQSNVMAAPLRLYQPELAKDAALYRQQEDDKKSTNTPSQYNRSRLISGQSSQSKLSFASQYSKGSGKLPSIGRSKPLEQGYEVPISFGKPKDKRSGSSSQAPVVRRMMLTEGGFIPMPS
jgi:hypothetical protein